MFHALDHRAKPGDDKNASEIALADLSRPQPHPRSASVFGNELNPGGFQRRHDRIDSIKRATARPGALYALYGRQRNTGFFRQYLLGPIQHRPRRFDLT